MKTIRFKNDWRYSREGDVIEEGDGVAQLLIARGIAEEVVEGEVPSEEVKQGEAETEEEDVEENQAEEVSASGSSEDAGTEPAQDGGENALPQNDALPQIITRQVPGPPQNPGPNEGRSRRGGRG